MKATQFAKLECCNHVADQCLTTKKPCLLEKRERCKWFEKAVAPLAKYKPQYVSAVDDYWGQKGLSGVTVKARFCGCGAQLSPRRRFCDSCTRQRRKDAYRNSRRNQ